MLVRGESLVWPKNMGRKGFGSFLVWGFPESEILKITVVASTCSIEPAKKMGWEGGSDGPNLSRAYNAKGKYNLERWCAALELLTGRC